MQPMPLVATLPPAAPHPPETERRGPERKRVLIPAIVLCEDGAQFRCIVRDMSVSGAKIGITRRHRLPERFRLVTAGRENGYPVRRAWQRGDYAGLILDVEEPGPADATEQDGAPSTA